MAVLRANVHDRGLLVSVGVLVDGDAYHTAIMNVDLTDRTGFVQVGSVVDPCRIVNMPVPPDDVLPEFSEIVGKLWLARAASDACFCAEQTATCGWIANRIHRSFIAKPSPHLNILIS